MNAVIETMLSAQTQQINTLQNKLVEALKKNELLQEELDQTKEELDAVREFYHGTEDPILEMRSLVTELRTKREEYNELISQLKYIKEATK